MAFQKIKKILMFIMGLLLMGLGTSVMINSNLGVSSFDALNVGLSSTFGFTTGTWCIVCGIILIFINAVLLHEKPSIASFMTSLLAGVFIDFWLSIFDFTPANYFYSVIILAIGLLIYTAGISIYIKAEIAKGPIDNFMIAIGKVLNKNYLVSKTISEVIFLILAVSVKGPIGIGTIFIVLFSGLFIQVFSDLLRRIQQDERNA